MYLFTPPEGQHITEQRARMLDDDFFLSDPLGHFASRISALLETAEEVQLPTKSAHPEFFGALGLMDVEQLPGVRPDSRHIHAAVDALALRHQVAEALTRFLYAITSAKPLPDDADCTWLKIAKSPNQIVDVVRANIAHLQSGPETFLELLFPAGTLVGAYERRAADTAVDWIDHASHLLTSDELSTNAAHNKVKHGLAISARQDIRVELLRTRPDRDGNIQASALGKGKSVPIFDRPLLTFLDRPQRPRPQGWEAVSLRVELPVVLAETWMMANVWGALFHVAGRKHFGDEPPATIAPYPTLVIDRGPQEVTGRRVLGARSPLTLPPDGSAPRDAGLFEHGAFLPLQIDFDSHQTAAVVDG